MRRLHQLQSRGSAGLFLAFAALWASVVLAQTADVGLSTMRAQRFGRTSLPDPNVDGYDRFASSFAVGDFNGDGADDLASGAPGSDGPSAAPVDACGAVVVRYGARGKGLDQVAAPTVLGQFVGGGSPEVGDQFGYALTACDLNGDAYDDLAVGVPWESIGYGFNLEALRAGRVEVYYGTNAGIVPPASTTRREVGDTTTFPVAETLFGFALACGDFNLDGYDDLAVGLPFRELGSATDAGRVNIYSGSASGIDGGAALKLDQDSPGMENSAAASDQFGRALAAGDFDGDGFDDLAVGVPFESGVGNVRAGGVHVLYGAEGGLGAVGNALFVESSFGGTDEGGDNFGWALAAGNFDADEYDDLAIGVPSESLSAAAQCGRVVEVFGSASGLGPAGAQFFDQDRVLGAGQTETNDAFGMALAARDFDGDGADDLAIGQPNEDISGNADGAVAILMGSVVSGLDPAPNRRRLFAHGLDGVPGNADEHGVHFGNALASGDFDGDGFADLAIGAPFESETLSEVGTLTVLYGALFADGLETGTTGLWSDVVPHS